MCEDINSKISGFFYLSVAIAAVEEKLVSILSFRRVLYVVCFLLGISPASEV